MIYTPLTKKAMMIINQKHNNQVDKSGMPYILHPIHVAEQMDDERSTILALLHDTIEDTDITIEELKDAGFSEEILEALMILTKPEDMDYFNYIEMINKNELAKKVKVADLLHNLDLNRLDKITDDDYKRVEKYKKALELLGYTI